MRLIAGKYGTILLTNNQPPITGDVHKKEAACLTLQSAHNNNMLTQKSSLYLHGPNSVAIFVGDPSRFPNKKIYTWRIVKFPTGCNRLMSSAI
jgi:hypothetical protein